MIFFVAAFSVFIYGLLIFWLIGSKLKESPFWLLLSFLLGVLSAVIALVAEYVWNFFLGPAISAHHSLIIVESFIGVGAIEETAKWVWLVFLIARWPSFSSYASGILYTCCIAAGFNLVEGVLYALTDGNLMDILVRSLTAVPVHFLFAIIMGFLFARFKFEAYRYLWPSLFVPILLHGLYDFFIFQQYAELLIGAAFLVLAGCFSLSVGVCIIALKADQLRLTET